MALQSQNKGSLGNIIVTWLDDEGKTAIEHRDAHRAELSKMGATEVRSGEDGDVAFIEIQMAGATPHTQYIATKCVGGRVVGVTGTGTTAVFAKVKAQAQKTIQSICEDVR